MYIKKGEEYIKIRKGVLISCILMGVALVAFLTIMIVNPFGPLEFAGLRKLKQGVTMLEEYYYEDVDTEKLIEGAMTGIALGVDDPYTVYMSKESAQSFIESIESDDYAGVGLYIYLDETDKRVTVSEPIEGSPAYEAGIVKGDKIIAINGETTENMDVDAVAAKMKGAEGTKVVVTILKAVSGEKTDVTLTRAVIERATVESEMITDKTGYIQISQFGVNTYDEFVEEFNTMVGEGMDNLVIDLRDNPGGYLEQAVEIADAFLSDGVIVYTLKRNGQKKEYNATSKKTTVPMVILVNGNSASASEILVGALKDYGVATIVGEQTFGKGVTQITCDFSDGSLMKVTDSRYYTPNGVCIDHKGIAPDVEVVLDTAALEGIEEPTYEDDNQLKKAVEILEK